MFKKGNHRATSTHVSLGIQLGIEPFSFQSIKHECWHGQLILHNMDISLCNFERWNINITTRNIPKDRVLVETSLDVHLGG